ncbi:hypothetical protein BU24DRAFT_491433 [Aaosphaeria arxii CBS 175.79]|uniref:Uncharacterized protein n=1 Tax=Aaosphaeria arxii CBS 175.79 TaxID=1450172 RepID=A0A6A5XYT5_9PLEO|nr:uncharacterized protein BU24DRAFT_491433 [Aaosphaeria arxii CBS 175.79]KAF2018475.1 hypothetical protein BU24DRAFT_491433 [Aaosphaeria arxii CBS 175.79]
MRLLFLAFGFFLVLAASAVAVPDGYDRYNLATRGDSSTESSEQRVEGVELQGGNATSEISQGQANTVTVKLGTLRQNVGGLKGPAIYDMIYKGLQSLCRADPLHPGRCLPEGFRIFPVNYIDGWHGQSKEPLQVTVTDSYYGDNIALRNLMIGAIASAIQRSTEDKKNCEKWVDIYPLNVHVIKDYCNIGDFVEVTTPNGRLVVSFQSSRRGGHYDCMAIIGKVDADVQRLMPEYNNAHGANLMRNVICSDKGVTN